MQVYDNHNNISRDTFGRDCCAVNFINIAMNKMRFEQGMGDPYGFKRQSNIKQSIIIRYVGNRAFSRNVSSCR